MSDMHANSDAHIDHHENIDPQGNANLAVWLGLVSLTFMTATFVGSNVYLRKWSPSKFQLDNSLLRNLPYVTVLLSVLAVLLLFVAAAFFKRDRWRPFRAVLALTTLVYLAQVIVQFNLMLWFAGYSKQVATIYAPTAVMEFLLSVVCIVLLAGVGWYSAYGNKRMVNGYFPVAMNVWLYTAFSNVVILLVENVVSVSQFAAWCGQHLT
ncbi:hypothetical protein GCM10025857_10300 [Alicyclobacillus contaminans]|uniref:hypothetical protein n=1 Tax=Alicyclobacillus contaminans TaxID=392016 RepID=UPI00041F6188|nr:hypothetical protein [Alicyclobacillus contaminans]GMA49673.1 hypothetical protein GCM10025857_10300 [Alicyclobacillus contaminans]